MYIYILNSHFYHYTDMKDENLGGHMTDRYSSLIRLSDKLIA